MTSNRYYYTITTCFAALAGAAAINTTFSLPEGTFNHGNPNLICTPTSWTDILTFFLGNYIAHAATVPSFHGDPPYSIIFNVISALLFPGFGLVRGVVLIMTFAAFGKTELEKALRAQALFMVVRSAQWRPIVDENVKHSILLRQRSEMLDTAIDQNPRGVHVCVYNPPWMTSITGLGDATTSTTYSDELHGNNQLPEGYCYFWAPREAVVEPLPEQQMTCKVSKNYNILKSVIALAQALYATMTLYQASRDQIMQYGYVAFNLTVAPYAVMSIVNLLAALFCPDYPETYLVETSILVEARNRGGKFHGVVGKLVEEEATFDACENDPDFQTMGDIVFSQSTGKTGATKMSLRIPESSVQKPEDKTGGLVEERPAQENSPNEIPRSPDRFKVCEVLGKSTEFEAAKDPIVLVPACSPFKPLNERAEEPRGVKKYFVEVATWDKSVGMWDVDIEGFIGSNSIRGLIGYLLSLCIACIPFAIIGGLSGFHRGKSTFAQRVWITAWLCVGQGYLILALIIGMMLAPLRKCMPSNYVQAISEILRVLLLGVSSVGGLVVVAQMLKTYGTCSTIA